MKEYQTELILTLKKRPKHSAGHLNLIKPFKLPIKEYSTNQNDLPPMNGSMTLKPSNKPRKPLPNEYSNEYTNLDELNANQLDAQMLTGSISRGKAAIRRRATISGSTSSMNTCGTVRVDDLLIKNHQTSTKLQNEVKQHQKPDSQPVANNINNNSQNVPFAKVQPLQQNEESSAVKQTVPKQLTNGSSSTFSVTGTLNGKSIATIKSTTNSNNGENIGIVLPNTSRTSDLQLKLSTFQQQTENNTSSQNLPNSQSSSTLATTIATSNESTDESATVNVAPPTKPPPPLRQHKPTSNNSSINSNHPPPLGEKPAIPMRPTKTLNGSATQQPVPVPQLNRFVTLKQVEEENALFFKQNPNSPLCQLINNSNSSTNNNTIDKSSFGGNRDCSNLLSGWLYTKREHFNTLLNANAKWSAKYVQLSTDYMLYAFRNELATKADLVINLAAFKVSPACECKSKENVFKTFNKHVIFLFACESQTQMRQWVDTLRQLVANCASTKPELLRISNSPDVACYSETEDEEDVIDDEMMLQNFANELVETTNQRQEETIESKIDISIKTDVDKQTTMHNADDEQIKSIKLADDDLQDSAPIKVANDDCNDQQQQQQLSSNEDDEEEKHNRRMMRLLNRRRQRYTSTAESCRDSSPSSTTSSASSSANTSAGQAVLSRFAAISELKERLQKQAQEKLEQRRLAIASGKKMYERSVSCMDASTISSFNSKLAFNQANTTNNTPMKAGLIRNKSGSQQSLLSPTTNEVFDLSPTVGNKPTRPAKPFYMTQQNKVLPSIPPRPPKPQSISIANTASNSTTNNNDKLKQSNTDELNKRSQQPLPQPRSSRTSKNGLSAAVDEQLADNVNKENINSNNSTTTNCKSNESILKKTLQANDAQKSMIPNHKDNEYISNIIDELYSFADESKPDARPIAQNCNQPTELISPNSDLLNATQPSLKKVDNSPFSQPLSLENNNFESNYQSNNQFNNNNNQFMNGNSLMNGNQLNEQQLQQLQSMLFNQDSNGGLVELNDDDLEDLDSFDEEECLDDEEFSDEEEEYNCMDKEYNMYNNGQSANNFGQNSNESNLFAFGGANHQMNENLNHNNSSNNVGFMAPGPNFLNSAPGVATMNQNHHNHHNTSSLLNNHQMDNHLRNDLSSSSNSNNYPTSSSTNSFNISPYSSISQHNHPPNTDNLPIQMDGTLNQVNQLNTQFAQQTISNGLMTDEHLSDSSSGVSSEMSAFMEAHSAHYYQQYQEDNAQQLATLSPEERQKFEEAFQVEFANQFAMQIIQIRQAQYVSSRLFLKASFL